jgi:hypothetical protein
MRRGGACGHERGRRTCWQACDDDAIWSELATDVAKERALDRANTDDDLLRFFAVYETDGMLG